MVNGHKLVVVTPAGRRRYLSVLAQYVLHDPDVDEWQLWLNSPDGDDTAFVGSLSWHPKVRVVGVPAPYDGPLAYRIHHFYATATGPQTVYVRLDDDVVYYAPGSVRSLAARRLSTPDPFIVYGNVLNTARSTFFHHALGRLPLHAGCRNECMDPVGWGDGTKTLDLHERFLADPVLEHWRLPDIIFDDYARHSINVISWTGADASRWASQVEDDEEVFVAETLPKRFNRPNLIAGDNLFVHYAFYTQREFLEPYEAGLLQRYGALRGTTWGVGNKEERAG